VKVLITAESANGLWASKETGCAAKAEKWGGRGGQEEKGGEAGREGSEREREVEEESGSTARRARADKSEGHVRERPARADAVHEGRPVALAHGLAAQVHEQRVNLLVAAPRRHGRGQAIGAGKRRRRRRGR